MRRFLPPLLRHAIARIGAGIGSSHRRVAAAWLVVACLGASGALEFATARGPLAIVENRAVTYLAASEEKAAVAFASARLINAAVSALKSADLGVVVFNIEPMQLLEPVDDLAKEFSDVMVVSIAAITMQQILLKVSQAWALAILLPIGALLLGLAALTGRTALGVRLSAIGRGIVVLALFARLTIPVAGWVGNSLTNGFLATELDSNISMLDQSAASLDQMGAKATATQAVPPDPSTAPTPGIFSGLLKNQFMRELGSAQEALDHARSWIPDRTAIENAVHNLPTHIVNLIAIFLVQTIVTPLAVALFLYCVMRALVRPVHIDAPAPETKA